MDVEELPRLRDVPDSERHDLFVRKLNLCCILYDFNDRTKDWIGSFFIKEQILRELVEYVSSPDAKISEYILQEIIKMVSVNLFRTLPHSSSSRPPDAFGFSDKWKGEKTMYWDPDLKRPSRDPAWFHLKLVYEFLLKIVDAESLCGEDFVDRSFVQRLLNNALDSDDPREGKFVGKLLYSLWPRFRKSRSVIWSTLSHMLSRFISESEQYVGSGLEELLFFLSYRIYEFSLPLQEEHRLFLLRVLIPLHKPNCFAMYDVPLTVCLVGFIRKDSKLADTIILGILKYWPTTNSSKEAAMMDELTNIITSYAGNIKHSMVPLLRQIGCCLTSSHYLVPERALYMLRECKFIEIVKQKSRFTLPIILPALEIAKNHWKPSVHALAVRVREEYCQIETEIDKECSFWFQEDEAQDKKVNYEAKWKCLEGTATSRVYG